MAVKSGTSHALAALILTILSAILIRYIEIKGFFEGVLSFLDRAGNMMIGLIVSFSNVELEIAMVKPLMVATILCFIWGVIYHYSRN